MKNLNDYIFIIKNALTYSLCDAILDEFKDSNEWQDSLIGNNSEIDKKVRNCQSIGISHKGSIEKNKKVRLKLDKYLFVSSGKCIQEYNNKFSHCIIEEDCGYSLLKYSEGCFYLEHTDSFKALPRAVSCSFMLNDNFEGGEFAFFNKELIYKLEKGDAIMFPSNFMYPHEIMPVTKGTRYSIITWFV